MQSVQCGEAGATGMSTWRNLFDPYRFYFTTPVRTMKGAVVDESNSGALEDRRRSTKTTLGRV